MVRLLIIAVFLITECFAEDIALKTTSIEINSHPDFADIYLDGEFKGISPLRIDDITEGNHSLQINHPTAGQITKTIAVKASNDSSKFSVNIMEENNLTSKNPSLNDKINHDLPIIKESNNLKRNIIYYILFTTIVLSVGGYYANKQINNHNETTLSIQGN